MPREATSCHVLMVIESDYPSMDGGGAEAQIETLTGNLPSDLRATVVAPLVPYGPRAVDDSVHGVPVRRIWYPRLPMIGGCIMLLRLALFVLARYRTIDAIHCHIAHNMAAVCAGLGWLLGIPVVVKLTGMRELENGILSANRSPVMSLRRWLVKRASALQAISEDLETGLIQKGFERERIHLIPNAVDTRLFTPAPEEQDDFKRKRGIEADFVACYVGRLVPEKALDMLIRAWDRAIPKEAKASLTLVGTGPLEDELKGLVDALGRAHQIVFPGFVKDKTAIADFWRVADIGLLTSDFEGLSNALLEAMASGVPMIGSLVSGNEDLITPGETGWLFEPRQQDQLEACLSDAFNMSAASRQRMGEAARQRALHAVGVDQIWRKLASLYLLQRQEDVALCAE